MSFPGTPVSFGKRYAILNLDWMTVLLTAAEGTPQGRTVVENLSKWHEAVHQKSDRPLTIYTTLAFNRGQPELEAKKPFARLIESFGTFEVGTPSAEIDQRFELDEQDIVLRKTRWSATTGNNLEQILRAQGIDTVVIVSIAQWSQFL
jgi:nicotinamidase-related amidase